MLLERFEDLVGVAAWLTGIRRDGTGGQERPTEAVRQGLCDRVARDPDAHRPPFVIGQGPRDGTGCGDHEGVGAWEDSLRESKRGLREHRELGCGREVRTDQR